MSMLQFFCLAAFVFGLTSVDAALNALRCFFEGGSPWWFWFYLVGVPINGYLAIVAINFARSA